MATYPRCKFHPDRKDPLVVKNEADEAALGEGWYDRPEDMPYVEPVEPEPAPAPGCPNCEALHARQKEMVAKFDQAYGELKAEHAELARENQVMKAELKKAVAAKKAKSLT